MVYEGIMAAQTLVIPETDSEEGYERPINIQTEGLGAAGFYPQHPQAGEADLAAGVERDANDNLVLKDPVTGEKTLAQLVAGASGLPTVDFLLDCDPTGDDFTYSIVYSGNKVTAEVWTLTATGLELKRTDYAYSGTKVDTEVTKVFAVDGTTIIGQTTTTYSYSGSRVTGATKTRDV